MKPIIKNFILTFVMIFQWGCATIFSGSTQKVKIESRPPEATVVIVKGLAASVLKYGTATSNFIKMFGKHLSKQDREFLERYDFESVLTALVSEASRKAGPKGKSKKVAKILKDIPPQLKKFILDKVGISEFALAPVSPDLARGDNYMVIGYLPKKKIALQPIEKDPNWVVLWNVLNLGIGAIIDLYTGAIWDLQTEPIILDVSRPIPLKR